MVFVEVAGIQVLAIRNIDYFLLTFDAKGRIDKNEWERGMRLGMDLFRDVLQYLQFELAPRLRDLPSHTSLLFFSDHGFIETPHFDRLDKYRTSRYGHGESSPFEVIVSWGGLGAPSLAGN